MIFREFSLLLPFSVKYLQNPISMLFVQEHFYFQANLARYDIQWVSFLSELPILHGRIAHNVYVIMNF